MSTLKEKIQSDIFTHMKAKNALELSTLRLVMSEIQSKEKGGKTPVEFSDLEVIGLLSGEVSKRRATAAEYTERGVHDRAERELAEAAVIQAYLPEPITETEVIEYVDGVVATLESPSMSDMGTVMKQVTPWVAKRFDGKRVSEIVRERLA